MELDTLKNFDTKNTNYLQVAKELDSMQTLEKVRLIIDYSVLLDNIKELTDYEDRWSRYRNLVIQSAKDLFTETKKIIHNKLLHIEPDTIYEYIVYHSIYRTYNGFESEHSIVKQLANDGYKILSDDFHFTYSSRQGIINSTYSSYLDSRLGIDLRVINPADELIGIQFKSESYLNLPFDRLDKYNKPIKESHHNKHSKAINNSICKDVYFIFHKDNSTDILRLDKDNYYYPRLEQDYLITSYLVTTTNKFGKPYLKYKDFKIDRKKAY